MGELKGLGRTIPDPAILIAPLRRREAIHSSTIEGTYTTAKQLSLFDLSSEDFSSEGQGSAEQEQFNSAREVYNYVRALDLEPSGNFQESVKQIHKTLLQGVRGDDKRLGEFREKQVFIGGNHRFVPPPAEHLETALLELEKQITNSTGKFDPLIDCFLVHYQFETIHPFEDGNGRVGRMLLANMIHERCGFEKPWLYLSAYFDKHREQYIKHLFNISARNDWASWIDFCLKATISQTKDTIERCNNLLILQTKWTEIVEKIKGSARLFQIVNQLLVNPFVQISKTAKQLNVGYPTAKSDLDKLVKAEILVPLEEMKIKTFFAPELLDVVYQGN